MAQPERISVGRFSQAVARPRQERDAWSWAPCTAARISAMQEIKPDQRWREGLNEVQVMNAFGVRIVIRPNGTKKDEEITEDDFRQRFTFVADR
jgi:hypothetical protein